jgi:hypothetical protein
VRKTFVTRFTDNGIVPSDMRHGDHIIWRGDHSFTILLQVINTGRTAYKSASISEYSEGLTASARAPISAIRSRN